MTLVTIAMLRRFESVIMTIGNSTTTYLRHSKSLADFDDFWLDKSTDADIATQTMPDVVRVKSSGHSFVVRRGSRILITGPSGCGKSTLVHQRRDDRRRH
jgi:ABC-type uncharacterized transport system fused permease/ATPase subunit